MFRKNLFKTYIWQFLSIGLSFASMFVVIPILSAEKGLYGIYMACMSLTIFLGYCDLGFVASGMKFLGEAYGRKDVDEEKRILGFTVFLLSIAVVIFILISIVVSIHPEWIIKSLENDTQRTIASQLLLLLCIPALGLIPTRLATMVLGVRIQDYIYRRISSIGSLLSISSVPFLFQNGKYPIVAYFCIVQGLAFLSAMITLTYVHRNLLPLGIFNHIRFSAQIFRKTGALASSSLVATIAWILYYEMDSLFISKHLGSAAVATFAVALSTTSFLRSILGSIYAPIAARMNQLIGVNDRVGLKSMIRKVCALFTPPTVIGVTVALLLYKDLVFYWVGTRYADSVSVGIVYFAIYLFSTLHYMGGNLMSALQKNRAMIALSLVSVVLYWSIIWVMVGSFGLISISVAKLVIFTLMAIVYTGYLISYVQEIQWKLILSRVAKLLFVLILCTVGIVFLRPQGNLPLSSLKLGAVIVSGLFWWTMGSVLYFVLDDKCTKIREIMPFSANSIIHFRRRFESKM